MTQRAGTDPATIHEHDVRRSYDAVAAAYADRISDELSGKPFDRDLLSRFARQYSPLGTLGDIGCGPGHVTAYLGTTAGADVVGVDLSPMMIEHARRRHPACRFEVGDMVRLNAVPGRFGGLVAFYSLVHSEGDALDAALAACHAALRSGGGLLAAVHLGDGVLERDEWWGHAVALRFRLFAEGELEAALRQAGFRIAESQVRDPYPEVEYPTRRAYVWAAKDLAVGASDDTKAHRRRGCAVGG